MSRILHELIDAKNVLGTALFIVMGAVSLASSVVGNPLVLSPRIWSTEVLLRTFVLNAALLIIGIGLIARRRWVALLAAATGMAFAVELGVSIGMWGLALLILPSLLTAVCWHSLTPANTRRDIALVAVGVTFSGIANVAAYVVHQHHWR